jgi:N-glycosylase/DNA lyase
MQQLVKAITELKQSKVKKVIDDRIKEFEDSGQKSNNHIFKELCFCILTANSTAERCLEVHAKVGDGFINHSESELQKVLKECGARFHTKRAGYIAEAQKYKHNIKDILDSYTDESQRRDWLAENIKGLGYKEASHFLRNIGYKNYAIIDFHIIDILAKYNIVERPKTLNRKSYIEIENSLKKLADKTDTNLAELDLYLWYMETGKVLK